MLKIQFIGGFIELVKNIFLSAYSGAIVQLFGIIRNYAGSKGYKPKYLFIFLILGQLTLGIVFNNHGILGYLPIVASIIYTIAIFYSDKAQDLRLVILVTNVLWIGYYIITKDYPALVTGAGQSLFMVLSIVKGDRD